MTFAFLDENYAFWDFLIDFLSVWNELNWFLMCAYSIFAAKNTGHSILNDFCWQKNQKYSREPNTQKTARGRKFKYSRGPRQTNNVITMSTLALDRARARKRDDGRRTRARARSLATLHPPMQGGRADEEWVCTWANTWTPTLVYERAHCTSIVQIQYKCTHCAYPQPYGLWTNT